MLQPQVAWVAWGRWVFHAAAGEGSDLRISPACSAAAVHARPWHSPAPAPRLGRTATRATCFTIQHLWTCAVGEPLRRACNWRVHQPLQMADKVIYSKFAGTELEMAGEEHVLLKVGPVAQGRSRKEAAAAAGPAMRLRVHMHACMHAAAVLHATPHGCTYWELGRLSARRHTHSSSSSSSRAHMAVVPLHSHPHPSPRPHPRLAAAGLRRRRTSLACSQPAARSHSSSRWATAS